MVSLSPQDASFMRSAMPVLGQAAWDIVRFHEENPSIAAMAGIEILAVESRTILRGGALDRISRGAVSQADMADAGRLESLVAQAGARMGAAHAALEAKESGSFLEGAGTWIGLAAGAIGLARSIF